MADHVLADAGLADVDAELQEFAMQVKMMGIKQVLSAPRSPWQRAYVERVIGTIRRECLEVPEQAVFVEHDQVIQALVADRADDSLDVSALPRGTRR